MLTKIPGEILTFARCFGNTLSIHALSHVQLANYVRHASGGRGDSPSARIIARTKGLHTNPPDKDGGFSIFLAKHSQF
jgi:hypothetical protein